MAWNDLASKLRAFPGPEKAQDLSAPAQSLWAKSAPPAPDTQPLEGDVQTQVAIIGAGYTGLSAALHLARKGIDATVIEAGEIGHGGSGRNVGLVNRGLWLPPSEVEKRLGADAGEKLNKALFSCPDLVFDLIAEHGILCEAERKGTLNLAHSKKGLKALVSRAGEMRAQGADVEILDTAETARRTGSSAYSAALYDPQAGTINPLGYVRGLARAALKTGARIHCGTKATAITATEEAYHVHTPKGVMTTSRVILATNAYTDGLWPGLEDSIFPVRFFQFATPPLSANVRRSILANGEGAWDTNPVMTAFRLDRNGRLIIGSIGDLPDGGGVPRQWAARKARKLFPQLDEVSFEHGWVGRIAFTPDHLPRLHEPAPGVVATIGYNGRGIGPGTLFGKALADYVVDADAETMPLPLSEPEEIKNRRWRSLLIEGAASADHWARRFV